MQHGMGLGDALKNYTLLAIGDGLVAQVPSLLLSTGVAVLVTRMSKSQDMSQQVVGQVFGQRSEEHTSELQSLMRISYAVFCLKKQKKAKNKQNQNHTQLTLSPTVTTANTILTRTNFTHKTHKATPRLAEHP